MKKGNKNAFRKRKKFEASQWETENLDVLPAVLKKQQFYFSSYYLIFFQTTFGKTKKKTFGALYILQFYVFAHYAQEPEKHDFLTV